MQFRSGQRDERRRRVLLDERLASSEGQTEPSESAKPDRAEAQGSVSKVYSDAALTRQQPPITCLIPTRPWTLLVLGLLGAGAVLSVQALYGHVYLRLAPAWQVHLEMLDPAARGSLASWMSSLILFLAALAALLAFTIRRHRLDDYHGRYQVWMWAANGLLLASLDAATGLHVAINALVEPWLGSLPQAGAWGVVFLSAGFGLLLARMVLEAWGCRSATGVLMLASCLYAAALTLRLHPAVAHAEPLWRMAHAISLLTAHACLLYSIMLFCRHVYLQAQGGTGVAAPKRKRSQPPKPAPSERGSAPATAPPAAKNVRIDAPHQKSPATAQPKVPGTQPVLTSNKNSLRRTEDDEAEQAISKAERRRLRKLERRHKRDELDSDDD